MFGLSTGTNANFVITTGVFIMLIKISENPKQIEDAMAPLVYAQLQDELPELYDRLIGFQLVDSKDEGTKNLAILPFNLPKGYWYMPVFFVSGKLKPLILLFSLESKMFRPATKDIVHYLMKPDKPMGGTPVPMSTDNGLVSNPNLYNFMTSPMLAKNSQALEGILSMMKAAMASASWEHKKGRGVLFPTMLKESSNNAKKAVTEVLKNNPDIYESMELAYPGIAESLKPSAMVKKEEPLLIIKTDADRGNTPEENEKLYAGDMLIDDRRKVTSLYAPDSPELAHSCSNITCSGFHRLLNDNGMYESKLCLIGHIPERLDDSKYDGEEVQQIVILDVDTGVCEQYKKRDVFGYPENKNWKSVWGKTIGVGAVAPNQSYIMLMGNAEYLGGHFVGPFRVRRVGLGQDNIPILHCSKGVFNSNFKLLTAPCGKNSIECSNNEIIISPDARFIKVVENRCGCTGGEEFKPGSLDQLVRKMFRNGIRRYSVKKAGVRYSLVNDKGYVEHKGEKNDMLTHLIVEKNLSLRDSEGVLKESSFMLYKQGSRLVKKEDSMGKAAIYYPPQETTYYEVEGNKLPSNTDVPAFSEDAYIGSRLGRDQYSRGIPTNKLEDDIRLAMQAMGTGTGNILDTMLVGTLAKGHNSTERIKEVVPIMNKCAHLLGTLLFTLWWTPKEYTTDFDTNEMYELEQTLLSMFKDLGDTALVLSLRKKMYGDA